MKKGLAKKKDETEYARAKEDIAGFEQLQKKSGNRHLLLLLL